MPTAQFKEYKVWDLPTRWFHWINAITVLSLIFVGLFILYRHELGIHEAGAKIGLKKLHVIIGYIFVINLIIRLIWAFMGNHYASWRAILPTAGSIAAAQQYIRSWFEGNPQQFIGHNPLGRFTLSLFFLLFILSAMTGLIRAGTDIYYPPFGGIVSQYLVRPGVDPGTLAPNDEVNIDPVRYEKIKLVKRAAGLVHGYSAYTIMLMIFLHIVAVTLTELKKGGSIVSAMFSGKKILPREPEDSEPADNRKE